LKSVQARIQCLILKLVRYPHYLMGGISDTSAARGYLQNAARHVGARVLIQEDIDNFFPATSDGVIYSIWREFFSFSPGVARILTDLTTYNQSLPQGAKTSSYLANLVFWASEPELFGQLSEDGFTYTRYIDDITISAKFIPKASALERPMRLISTMLIKRGYRLKRKKHKILRAGGRMQVTGVTVDTGISIGQDKRARIRAAVNDCELLARTAADHKAVAAAIRSTHGRVAELKALHAEECAILRRRLDSIRPALA
jgi:retron-type reverse transcriptase